MPIRSVIPIFFYITNCNIAECEDIKNRPVFSKKQVDLSVITTKKLRLFAFQYGGDGLADVSDRDQLQLRRSFDLVSPMGRDHAAAKTEA